MGIRCIGLEGRVVRHENFIDAVFAQLPGDSFDPRAAEDGVYLFAKLVGQLPGGARQFKTDLAEGAVPLFCNDPYTLCHVHILHHSTSIIR